jgi:hypothetical protein
MLNMAEAEAYYRFSKATVEEIAEYYGVQPRLIRYAAEDKGWTRDYPLHKDVVDPAEQAELDARIITALSQPGIAVRLIAMQYMALEKLKDTLATYNPSESPNPAVIKMIVSAMKEITESLNSANPTVRETKNESGMGSITVNVLSNVEVRDDDRTTNRMVLENGSTVNALPAGSDVGPIVEIQGSEVISG